MEKLRKIPVWVSYTFFFAVIIAVYWWTFHLTNRSLIWSLDGIAQHYPILVNFRNLLTHFLTHPSQGLTHWSFNIGLGADQLTSFSYYVVGDLFNYLIVFFPKNQIELGYSVLVLLRLYCAGLAFLFYLNCFRFRKVSRLISTLTYTFSSFALYAGMHHAFFLLPLIFFPLLAAGIERILQQRSWFPLFLAVLITFLSNFYFAYMLGLGCLVYVGIRFLMLRKTPGFKWFRSLLQLTGTVVLGILAAAVLFIPTMLYAFQSTRLTGAFANGYWFYPPNYYLNLPSKILGLGGPFSFWLIIGMSGISFYAVVYVFAHFKRYRYVTMALILVGIGILFPAVSATFNALASPSNRWLALALLPLGLATAIFADHLTRLTRRDLLTMGISTVILLFLLWGSRGFLLRLQRHDVVEYLLLLTLLALFWLAKDYHWRPRTIYLSVLGIVTVNLMALGLGYYSPNNSGFTKGMLATTNAATYTQHYYDGANNYVKQRLGNYRTSIGPRYHYFPDDRNNSLNTDYFNASSNAPMNLDTHDIASYLTVENGYVGNLERAVRNNQFTPNDPVAQNDYRSTLSALMGVKYLFIRSEKAHHSLPAGFQIVRDHKREPLLFAQQNPMLPPDQQQGTVLAENRNALPLMYNQTRAIAPATWNRLNPVEKEQALLAGTVVDSAKIKPAKLRPTAKSLSYTTHFDQEDWITTPKQLAESEWAKPDATFSVHHPTKQQLDRVLTANQQRQTALQQQNRQGLHELKTDVWGKHQPVTIKIKRPQTTKQTELYLELEGIQASGPSATEQNQVEKNLALVRNQPLTGMNRLNEWRKNLQTANNGSFKLIAKTKGMSNAVTQLGTDELSNYVPKHSALLNLGYSSKVRSKITLTYQGVDQINFKRARVIAVPMKQNYTRQIRQLQKQRLRHIQQTSNQITGINNQPRTTVLTTSIPYSTGWQLHVDNRPVTTKRVNDGFVGGIIPAGKHRVTLQYHTPGLLIGSILTMISGILVLGISLITWLIFKRKHA
ncbi:YfhO family protein [Fructilactobacillus carniphilus]|uniref:YfhO family protein n=1 Tax=Fructilactobacillus carniphilus TaxID=2940297 RepID=A0ABY5BY23_9LACO|nr:YfhO family protein [Fructilactobacillus carniphilus]USS90538.1 YfhO family protein [Fructilactobacillus carniphilus]